MAGLLWATVLLVLGVAIGELHAATRGRRGGDAWLDGYLRGFSDGHRWAVVTYETRDRARAASRRRTRTDPGGDAWRGKLS